MTRENSYSWGKWVVIGYSLRHEKNRKLTWTKSFGVFRYKLIFVFRDAILSEIIYSSSAYFEKSKCKIRIIDSFSSYTSWKSCPLTRFRFSVIFLWSGDSLSLYYNEEKSLTSYFIIVIFVFDDHVINYINTFDLLDKKKYLRDDFG